MPFYISRRTKNKDTIKEEFAERKEFLTALPFYFALEPVRGCISRCIMCYAYKQNIAYTNLASIKNTIKKISPYCTHLTLSGAGEPLMHPQIKEILEVIKEYNIVPIVCTNAILLDAKISDFIAGIPGAQIRISLDAARRQTYRKIRGVDCFDEVMENIKRLLAAKEIKRSNLKIIINYLLMRQNLEEVIPLMTIFKGCKIYFNFCRLIRGFFGAQRNSGLLHQKCEAFKEQYNESIQRALDFARRNNIQVMDAILL